MSGSPLGQNYGAGAAQASADRASALDAAKNKALGDFQSGGADAFAADVPGVVATAKNYANPGPQMGGYAGGANDAANQMGALAAQARNRGAPIVDTQLANSARQQYQATHGAQGQALGLLGASAAGAGPSAAQATFGANLSQQMQQQAAGAGATRGGIGLASAQQHAAMAGGNAGVGAAAGAGQMRAGELQSAQGAYLSGGLGMGNQSLAAQGQDFNQGLTQAQLDQRQQQINQNASLGYLGYANDYQNAQLGADTARYASDQGAGSAAADAAQQQQQAVIGAGVGAGVGGLQMARQYGGAR